MKKLTSPNAQKSRVVALCTLLIMLLLIVGCGGSAGEPESESMTDGAPAAGESSDVADAVEEVVEELEGVDAEPAEPVVEEAEEFAEETMADESMAEDEGFVPEQANGQSIGQEEAAQSTPFAPRDKQLLQVPPTAQAPPTAELGEVRGDGESEAEDVVVATAPIATAAPVVPTAEPVRSAGDTATPPPPPTLPAATAVSNSPRPVMTPTPIVEEVAQLRAGVVDDNQQFVSYLDYLDRYAGPVAEWVDVGIRHRILVVDSAENPVLGATVRIYDNDRGELVQTLRTHADGGAWFFPNTVSAEIPSSYDIEVIYQSEIVYADSFMPSGDTSQLVQIDAPSEGELALDILLLIDTTGSMGDEIAELKANIRAIAQRTLASDAEPDLRFAMVTYRDVDDEYRTQVADFSADVQQFEDRLNEVTAFGGGDYPEDLNQGLDDALNAVNWRDGAIQLIFLVADAPPHLDYGQPFDYADAALAAGERGIKIYPIASSGLDQQGEYVFRQLAQLTGSQFIFLVDDEADEAEATESVETGFAVESFTVGALDDVVMEIIEQELAFQNR